MKESLLSASGVRWDGFGPFGYGLDPDVLLELPLTHKEDGATGAATTIGKIYDCLQDKQIGPEFFLEQGIHPIESVISTSDGTKLVLGGPNFNRRVLDVMLRLREGGVNPFLVSWYFYDKEWSKEGQEAYSFFLVHDGKIVQENVTFYDYHNSGFEPSVFGKNDHSEPLWSGEVARAEADARYWYRRFYSETATGQRMLLRSDKPRLFFFEDLQGPDAAGALRVIARSLNSVRILLWVLVILTVLSVVLRWK